MRRYACRFFFGTANTNPSTYFIIVSSNFGSAKSALVSCRASHQISEGSSFRPQEEKREHANTDEHRVPQSFTASDKDMERKNVDDDRSQYQQSQVPGARNDDQ